MQTRRKHQPTQTNSKGYLYTYTPQEESNWFDRADFVRSHRRVVLKAKATCLSCGLNTPLRLHLPWCAEQRVRGARSTDNPRNQYEPRELERTPRVVSGEWGIRAPQSGELPLHLVIQTSATSLRAAIRHLSPLSHMFRPPSERFIQQLIILVHPSITLRLHDSAIPTRFRATTRSIRTMACLSTTNPLGVRAVHLKSKTLCRFLGFHGVSPGSRPAASAAPTVQSMPSARHFGTGLNAAHQPTTVDKRFLPNGFRFGGVQRHAAGQLLQVSL